MKLLDKKLLNEDANLQKKEHISEGVRIARKVDLLREELSSLERQREQFIKGSADELKKAIGDLQARKEELDSLIAREEQLLKEKRKPLDDEWADLSDKWVDLNKRLAVLTQLEYEFKKKTTIFEEEQKRLHETISHIAEQERTASENNRLAFERSEQAKGIRDSTIRDAEAQRTRSDEENRKLAFREKEADGMAKALDRFEKDLAQREENLNAKERRINDKYETLQRTIIRLNKKDDS